MVSKAKPSSDRSLKRIRTEATAPLKTTDNTQAFLKFLVLHCEYDLPLGKLSPFLVAKTLEASVGKSYKAKKLHSGDLLVEVEKEQQSIALLGLTRIADHKVTVTPHRSLNTNRGVISEEDLLESTEDEILEGHSNQGVIAVKRITLRRDDQEKPSKHLVLTFNSTTLPQAVKAGYLNCKVRPYITNPRRCFSCQRLGHGAATCRGQTTCGKCSSNDHPTDNCASDFSKCVNCSGAHPAYSRSRPKFKEEKEILTLKTKEKLTYLKPENASPKKRHSFLSQGSFAEAARRGPARPTVSAVTQTSTDYLCVLPKSPSTSPGVVQATRLADRREDPGPLGSTQAQRCGPPAPAKTQLPRGRGIPLRTSEGARKLGEPSGSQARKDQAVATPGEPVDESGSKSDEDRLHSRSESLLSASGGTTGRPKDTAKIKNSPRIKIDFKV
ncbi:unnamed protein product [Ixodes persulcatus]